QNECYLKQAACKQQSEILLVSEGSCATGVSNALQSASKTYFNEGSGETNQKETSTCDICQFGAECDEDAEDVWCVCNIDCSQTNFNPLCASDGKSYDNACQIKEASCQKQEKIEVMSLGRCQGNQPSWLPHTAVPAVAQAENQERDVARGIYIPCPEHYNGFCMHGKCEHSTNMLEPSCRCDAGYTGQHCEKKDYSVLYVVPGPVRFQYVLIAAVIGTIQIAIICVVVLCITRKCPRSNRIHRQKQNTGHYSSDNTTRASTRLI
uniref:Transmembrane protein with EGF like and two follistatin like domains 2 n=1 Tax=Apteryx owenii TaxID=8824 RepID=A0A8B9PL95_APTOW